jgi:hypothetical protein
LYKKRGAGAKQCIQENWLDVLLLVLFFIDLFIVLWLLLLVLTSQVSSVSLYRAKKKNKTAAIRLIFLNTFSPNAGRRFYRVAIGI